MDFWNTNLILKVRSGSQAHGLATPQSDDDSRGICIPPKRFLLGLDQFEQHQSEGGDHVVYSLVKFVRLALEGNPNIIETLFTEAEDVLYLNSYGQALVDFRMRFLSRLVGERFSRYALHQLKKIQRHYRWLTDPPKQEPLPTDFGARPVEQGFEFPNSAAERLYRGEHKRWRNYLEWRRNRNKKRAALEQQHGYDTKHAMHLCRLLLMGQEILARGEVLVRRPDATWLRDVREGTFTYPELLDWAQQHESELVQLRASSPLPEQPDRKGANQLVVSLQERALRDGFLDGEEPENRR